MTTRPSPPPDRDPGAGTPRSHLLIGDADRARAQDTLSRAVGLGELTLDEFDDRLQAALRARTASDLRLLLSDLPSAATDLVRAPAAWTPPVAPAASPSVQIVDPAPRERRGSATRARPTRTIDAWVRWAALAALMVAIWVAVGIPTGAWYPWPIWPILGTAVCAVRQSVERPRAERPGIGLGT